MNRRLLFILTIGIVLLLASACGSNPPEPSQFAKRLDKGYATYYGNYYAAEGLDAHLLSLDIYSPTITIDSAGRIGGTGTNVYLSDIFIPNDEIFMRRGEYKCDTTYKPFTFLAGIEYEGHYSGAYLLSIKENGYSVTLVKSGTMTVSYVSDSTIINFELMLDNPGRTTYTGEYRGVLPYYDTTNTIEQQPSALRRILSATARRESAFLNQQLTEADE